MTNELIYGAYILIWPAITFVVLGVICRAVARDVRRARKSDEDLI
ncbi:putative transporter small subunit [Marinobacter vulgaris]|nr:putative transporter small subunit [Marinobacter vulgaris]